jgi:UrcA family protein
MFVMFVRLVSSLGALAATAATVAFATPAVAQEETRSTIVSFAGLDLTKPADAARLDRRLRIAARQVCESGERATLRVVQEVRDCETAALAHARADVQLALRGGTGSQVALTTR